MELLHLFRRNPVVAVHVWEGDLRVPDAATADGSSAAADGESGVASALASFLVQGLGLRLVTGAGELSELHLPPFLPSTASNLSPGSSESASVGRAAARVARRGFSAFSGPDAATQHAISIALHGRPEGSFEPPPPVLVAVRVADASAALAAAAARGYEATALEPERCADTGAEGLGFLCCAPGGVDFHVFQETTPRL